MTKMPSSWVTAKATQPKEVQAKIDMSAEVAGRGLCPECRQPMVLAYAGTNPMHICAQDRIAMPIPD